jgi:flagellum-specific ATP synthase
MINIDFKNYEKRIKSTSVLSFEGKVVKVVGLTIEAEGLKASVGEICFIQNLYNKEIKAEVVGFRDNLVILMPLGELIGIAPGCKVISNNETFSIRCSNELLGRVVDGIGEPIDNKGGISGEKLSIYNSPPNPMTRKRITDVMPTGIKAIDGCMTVGVGQRIGLFAGSGVGKSTTMGMIAKYAKADVNVICLVGERGREVLDFLERDLGEEGMKKSVIVCSTSDRSPLVRVKGALTATTIAEYFRDQGKNVILMMDSVTRFAMAKREIGLAVGEPPAQKGYTPSVFAELPKLMERAGTSDKGSITAFYTVLVDGDNFNEPIADSVRGILDGHIVLSRDLAHKNHYPAIDVSNSISRLMNEIVDTEHKVLASKLRDILATHKEAEDLINIGAYEFGTNESIDTAINYIGKVNDFLKQSVDESFSFEENIENLKSIFK